MFRYIFIVFIMLIFANDNSRFAERNFINYGRIDAGIESKDNISNLLLVQISILR